MSTICGSCIDKEWFPCSEDSIPRPPGLGSSALVCQAYHVFDMASTTGTNRVISTFEENLCEDCIDMLPGERLPKELRLIRRGVLPLQLWRFSVIPILRFQYNLMYRIELEGRYLFVMGISFYFEPYCYWNGQQWCAIDENEPQLAITSECDFCGAEKSQPTSSQLVRAIFDQLKTVEDTNKFGDNGDDIWNRTMSGGEETQSDCDDMIFPSD